MHTKKINMKIWNDCSVARQYLCTLFDCILMYFTIKLFISLLTIDDTDYCDTYSIGISRVYKCMMQKLWRLFEAATLIFFRFFCCCVVVEIAIENTYWNKHDSWSSLVCLFQPECIAMPSWLIVLMLKWYCLWKVTERRFDSFWWNLQTIVYITRVSYDAAPSSTNDRNLLRFFQPYTLTMSVITQLLFQSKYTLPLNFSTLGFT